MFACREAYNTQHLEVLKNAISIAVAGPDRLLLGDSDALYMLDVPDEELYKFSDKEIRKVTQIKVIPEENVIVLLAGLL